MGTETNPTDTARERRNPLSLLSASPVDDKTKLPVEMMRQFDIHQIPQRVVALRTATDSH